MAVGVNHLQIVRYEGKVATALLIVTTFFRYRRVQHSIIMYTVEMIVECLLHFQAWRSVGNFMEHNATT